MEISRFFFRYFMRYFILQTWQHSSRLCSFREKKREKSKKARVSVKAPASSRLLRATGENEIFSSIFP